MVSAMRDQVLALACLRHGVPAVQGRGIDSLPPEATVAVAPAIVRALDILELKRAFAAVTEALLVETKRADPGLANRLTGPQRNSPADDHRFVVPCRELPPPSRPRRRLGARGRRGGDRS